MHGMDVSAEDQAAPASCLSGARGLAPSQLSGWRHALAKDPDAVEAIEPPLNQMCARCHTGARVMLQRRTAEEWLLHVDFHVGPFLTVEFQTMGRDREWSAIARSEIAPLLAKKPPLDQAVRDAWLAAPQHDPEGRWIVLADMPGHGAIYGALDVAGGASPRAVTGTLTDAAGEALPVSEDGERLEGRQFLRGADSVGGRLTDGVGGHGCGRRRRA